MAKNRLHNKHTSHGELRRCRFVFGLVALLLLFGVVSILPAAAQTPARPRWIDFGSGGFSNFRLVDWNGVVRVIFHREPDGSQSVAVATNNAGSLAELGKVTSADSIQKIRAIVSSEPPRWVRMQISLPGTGAWQDPAQYEAYGDVMQVKRITVTQSIDNPIPDPTNPGEYHLALTDGGTSIGRVIVPAEKVRLLKMIADSWSH